jgi:hypothetical protein
MEVEFFRQIFGNLQISMFTKICRVRAKIFNADGQRDGHNEASSCYSQLKKTISLHRVKNIKLLYTDIYSSIVFFLCSEQLLQNKNGTCFPNFSALLRHIGSNKRRKSSDCEISFVILVNV